MHPISRFGIEQKKNQITNWKLKKKLCKKSQTKLIPNIKRKKKDFETFPIIDLYLLTDIQKVTIFYKITQHYSWVFCCCCYNTLQNISKFCVFVATQNPSPLTSISFQHAFYSIFFGEQHTKQIIKSKSKVKVSVCVYI